MSDKSEGKGDKMSPEDMVILMVNRSFHHLIITSKPFNHQQWSQDGKRLEEITCDGWFLKGMERSTRQ